MPDRDLLAMYLPPVNLISETAAATLTRPPTSFSYQPTPASLMSITTTALSSMINSSAIQSSSSESTIATETVSGMTSTSTPWYESQWREPITYMLIIYVITSAIVLFGLCYYGYLDHRLDFHFSTRRYRRALEGRLQQRQAYRDQLSARAQAAAPPGQHRSSASTELGDSEEDELQAIQREWATGGAFFSHGELRRQRLALAQIALQRPHLPPRTTSRQYLLGARSEEDMSTRRERDAEVLRRLQVAGLI